MSQVFQKIFFLSADSFELKKLMDLPKHSLEKHKQLQVEVNQPKKMDTQTHRQTDRYIVILLLLEIGYVYVFI